MSLVQMPYLILLVAGALAGASAVALRRAAQILGAWLRIPAGVISAGGMGASAWGLYWAWSLELMPGASRSLPLALLGWPLVIAGIALAGWALAVRGLGSMNSWSAGRLFRRAPYRAIKRPVALGLGIAGLGATLVADTVAAWTGYAAWVLLSLGVLELDEWELRARDPALAQILRSVPRYLPRRPRK